MKIKLSIISMLLVIVMALGVLSSCGNTTPATTEEPTKEQTTETKPDQSTVEKAVYDGFAVSCDNAHARHPNHPELSDSQDAPILGAGVAIKYNARQKYTTDGVSGAVFRTLATRAGEKTQKYSNRADMPGGSTLGSISNTKVPILTVDVGVPQLAMHSATELCHMADVDSLANILAEFYSVNISACSDKITIEK